MYVCTFVRVYFVDTKCVVVVEGELNTTYLITI